MVKYDSLVSSKLHEALSQAFDTLWADQQLAPDWHPHSTEMVQDLVHPSMYPLVYGRSKVIKEEVFGVVDAIRKWAGKGNVIAKDDWISDPQLQRIEYNVGSAKIPPQYWSSQYQWLPANLAFQEDGRVKFTSYINNLHPNRYPEIYETIESLINTAIPAWDQCLASAAGHDGKEGPGRIRSRFSYPADPD